MKHKSIKASDLIKSGNKNCPRCGDGVYMAQHKNNSRSYCGKCHMTIFDNEKKSN